jgi:hypothetical protein
MQNEVRNYYIIGIDPAFREDGFAICIEAPDEDVSFKSFKSFEAFIYWILGDSSPSRAMVCVENSNLQTTYFPKYSRSEQSFRAELRKAMDAGKNQAVSEITVGLCSFKYGKANVLGLSPKEKGGKLSPSIVKGLLPKTFKGRLSQDKCDAWKMLDILKRRIKTGRMAYSAAPAED